MYTNATHVEYFDLSKACDDFKSKWHNSAEEKCEGGGSRQPLRYIKATYIYVTNKRCYTLNGYALYLPFPYI